MKAVDVQRMLDHCAKLIKANDTVYVDPDSLAMAKFIIEQHAARGEADKALEEALDLFDGNWCTVHGHEPSSTTFDRITKLRKRLQPDFKRDRYP